MTPFSLWLAACGVLLITELLSGSVFTLCLAIGAAVAAGSTCLAFPPLSQWIFFIGFSAICFVFIEPFMKRLYSYRSVDARTYMDAMIGQTARVTKAVDGTSLSYGRVQIDGTIWLAYTDKEVLIPENSNVIVEGYDSIRLKVTLPGQA